MEVRVDTSTGVNMQDITEAIVLRALLRRGAFLRDKLRNGEEVIHWQEV
jgi:hypothetical protein